jgi:hypothetical protein
LAEIYCSRFIAGCVSVTDRGERGLEMLTYPEWKTNRQLALVAVVVAIVVLGAYAYARWRESVRRREAE